MRSMRRLLHRNLEAVAGLTRDMAESALSFCPMVSAGFLKQCSSSTNK